LKNFVLPGSSGLPISFDIHFPQAKEASPLIIFLHGFKGFKDWGQWPLLAKEMALEGFAVLRMSFSHNGTTPESPIDFADLEAFGNNTFSKELGDVQDVLNWIESNAHEYPKIDANQVHVMAHSRGGAIALIASNEDDRIKKIVTLSGVGDLVRFTEDELAYWKAKGTVFSLNGRTNQQLPMHYSLAEDYLSNEKRFAPLETVQKLNKPYLIIHAADDETVLLHEANQLNERGKFTQLEIIENANHSFGGKHPFTETELPKDTKKAMDLAMAFLA
jgi:pimeloyl-ACP methyl ester carboxylesterase